MYLLTPGMDWTEEIIRQHLYWPSIINSVHKEVTNGDTCQRTKRSNIKYGKLPSNLSEETTRNKIYVYLIGPYFIRINKQKDNLNLKAVTMIDTVKVWFEIMKYKNKRAISIANLVKTMWLYR